MTPLLRMSHISAAVTPISAAITGSGSDDSAQARSNRALRLIGIRSMSAPRVVSNACRCRISRPADAASALTTIRQELAASISAFTHCPITERIYVSYSFDVLAGNRSINELSASS